jgi:hypothetical protein
MGLKMCRPHVSAVAYYADRDTSGSTQPAEGLHQRQFGIRSIASLEWTQPFPQHRGRSIDFGERHVMPD